MVELSSFVLAGCALLLVTAGSAAAADFTPGSSGLGDPFFPNGGNGGYDVANYDLIVRSGGKVVDRTTRSDSKDRINYRIACRDRRTETLRITVIKRSGPGGPYTLTAKYAG